MNPMQQHTQGVGYILEQRRLAERARQFKQRSFQAQPRQINGRKCPQCGGSGRTGFLGLSACDYCHGTGLVCPMCDGTGRPTYAD
jgi:hypothetical protein